MVTWLIASQLKKRIKPLIFRGDTLRNSNISLLPQNSMTESLLKLFTLTRGLQNLKYVTEYH